MRDALACMGGVGLVETESPLMKWERLRLYLQKVYAEAGIKTQYGSEVEYLAAIKKMPTVQLTAVVAAFAEAEKVGVLSAMGKRQKALAEQELAHRTQDAEPPQPGNVIYAEPVFIVATEQERKKKSGMGIFWPLLIVSGLLIGVVAVTKGQGQSA